MRAFRRTRRVASGGLAAVASLGLALPAGRAAARRPLPQRGRAGDGGRRGAGEGTARARPDPGRLRRARGRKAAVDRELRDGGGSSGPDARRSGGAAAGQRDRSCRGTAGALVRDRLRQRPPLARSGRAGEEVRRGVREDRPGRRGSRPAPAHRRRLLVDGAHERRPRGPAGRAGAVRRPAHPADRAGAAHRPRGAAHLRVQGQTSGRRGDAAVDRERRPPGVLDSGGR